MTNAAKAPNEFKLEGKVTKVIDFKFGNNGKPSGRLEIFYHEIWATGERSNYITVNFYGKPAQEILDANVEEGDTVFIFGSLGSFDSLKPEFAGKHFTNLKGISCTLKAKGDKIPFGEPSTPKPLAAGATEIP